MMLWRFNLMWPDQANPRPREAEAVAGVGRAHERVLQQVGGVGTVQKRGAA